MRPALREPLKRVMTHAHCSLRDKASLPAQQTADPRQAVLVGEELYAMYSGVADGRLVDALRHRHGHCHLRWCRFAWVVESSAGDNHGREIEYPT